MVRESKNTREGWRVGCRRCKVERPGSHGVNTTVNNGQGEETRQLRPGPRTKYRRTHAKNKAGRNESPHARDDGQSSTAYEAVNAYDYYESKRGGLGETFADAVQVVLGRIGQMPRIHRVVFADIRRAVVRGFPYCVYYREEASLIRVLSVFHTSRDPAIWQSRG